MPTMEIDWLGGIALMLLWWFMPTNTTEQIEAMCAASMVTAFAWFHFSNWINRRHELAALQRRIDAL